MGNRIQETVDGVTTAFTYDDNDRLTQTGGTTYTHDANGNTLTETLDGNTKTYTYNSLNQLIRTTAMEGGSAGNDGIDYQYNVDGIRTGQDDGTNATAYIVDSNRDYAQVLTELTDNVQNVTYVYGDDLVSQTRTEGTFFYHYDGLGSTRGLTDATGSLTDTWDYDAFGEILHRTGSTENDYLFTGEQFDPNLNQYYLRARYYDQGIGRFTQMDTWMGRNHDPITLHKYLYAHADPANYIDPTGNAGVASFLRGQAIILDFLSKAHTGIEIFQVATGEKELSARELGTSILLNRLPIQFAKNIVLKACKINSFEEGTLVSTDNGLKLISEVNIGDLVWSYDVESDEFLLKEVVHLISSNGLKEIVEVSLNNSEVISTTLDHPFYVADSRTWIVASNLKAGDNLLDRSGNLVSVSEVKITQKDTSVYNLTVDETHNYFVGNEEVLNHNNNCFKLKSRIKESPRLAKEAEKAGKNQKAQKDIDDLTKKLSEGNLNPGKGTKPIGKGISEARGENAGRVYFRVIKGEIEILGKSDKSNQDIVIKEILKTFK